MSVERALYKALKRSVDAFDRNVALRALLTAVPQRLYHRGLGRVVEIDSSSLANSVLERVVREVNEGADFYRPGRKSRPRLAAETLRRTFRDPPVAAGGAPGGSSALDAGFEALRWLNAISSAFDELPVCDYRPVRAPGVELAAEQSAPPRIGDVLLTHPIACLRQPSLHQAAILLAEGGDVGFGEDAGVEPGRASRGVMGIVLNKPTRLTLGQLLQAGHERETAELLRPFRQNVVYVGGDVMRDRLLMLHPYADVQDAARVADGVYMSSDLAAIHAAVQGGKDVRAFRVFVGHCGWAHEQLALECERGVWFTARGEPGAIARLAVQSHCFLDEDAGVDGLAPVVPAEGGKEAQYLQSAQCSVYCALLGGLSDEHRALTLLGGHDADVLLDHLQSTVERHAHGLTVRPDGGEGGEDGA